MAWRQYFEIATGRPTSNGTVFGPTPPGYDFVEFADKPPDSDMWDDATASFIPRPPKLLFDRMDDMETNTHPTFVAFQTAFNQLNPQNKARVRNAIRFLLLDFQIRSEQEKIQLGDGEI